MQLLLVHTHTHTNNHATPDHACARRFRGFLCLLFVRCLPPSSFFRPTWTRMSPRITKKNILERARAPIPQQTTEGLKNNIKHEVFYYKPERSHRGSPRALRDMKPGLLKYARAFLLAKGATGTERGGLEFTERINVSGSTKLDPAPIKTSAAAPAHVLCTCGPWLSARPRSRLMRSSEWKRQRKLFPRVRCSAEQTCLSRKALVLRRSRSVVK